MTLVDLPFSSSSSCFGGDSFDLHSSRKMTFVLLKQHLIKIVFLSKKTDAGLQKHALSSSMLSDELSCRFAIHYLRWKPYFVPKATCLGL